MTKPCAIFSFSFFSMCLIIDKEGTHNRADENPWAKQVEKQDVNGIMVVCTFLFFYYTKKA